MPAPLSLSTMAEILQLPAIDKPPLPFTDDILIEIFLKVPVRSLFLFRSVCKHWLHLIESPYLVQLHLKSPNNNPNNNPILVLHAPNSESHSKTQNSESNSYTLSLLSDDETQPYKCDLPLVSLDGSPVFEDLESPLLLGPCNGIFCISDISDSWVFNPTTRVCMYVPPKYSPKVRPKCCDITTIHLNIGFGFDPVSDDYKVVRLRELSNYDGYFEDDTSNHRHYNFGIFSLRTSQWSEVDHVLKGRKFCRIGSDFLFCNGAFHWLVGEEDYTSAIPHWINAFDLNKEALRQFELPAIEHNYEILVSVVDDSLAIIEPCIGMRRNLHESEKFRIWVMKEYGVYKSWNKLYSINVEPLPFGNGGEFLLTNSNHQLQSINSNTGAIKELEVNGATCYAFRFKESLVSLKRS